MRKLIFIAVLLSFGVSCQEVEKVQPTLVKVASKMFEPEADIEFNGEYLVFPTPESFKKTYASLINSDPQSVREWSTKLGFNSTRMIYETALEEQEKYLSNLLSQYKSFSSGDPRLKVKPIIVQPDFVKVHAYLLDFDSEGLIWRPKLSNYDMTALVNKDGLVKVAGHLFQYNKDNTKIIVGGDPGKITNLVNVNETNEKLNIVVNPTNHEFVKKGQKELQSETGRIWYDYWNQSNHWPDPSAETTNKYYMNYEVHISISSYPLYGTTPICEPEGCGQARTSEAMECNCYYPIIGYIGFSRFENHMETRKSWMDLINTGYHSLENTIAVDYKILNDPTIYHASYSQDEYVNTYLTIYDGTPAIEFVCGDHDFYSMFLYDYYIPSNTLERTVNVSWCD
ncbi:MAG TPA: hypothetical protein VFU05_08225 [Cyclobacteriaceae bacterium]|nr:hypothetical protein [Cyclobacteriaceae bacterium]